MNVGTLTSFLKLDRSEYTSGMNQAQQQAKQMDAELRKMEGASKQVTSSMNILGKAAVTLATSYAVVKLLEYAKDAAMMAARYETLGVVMNVVGNNAGYNSMQMDTYSKSLQKNGIALLESRSALTKMAQANIDLSKASDLARIAQDTAVIGNINSSESFDRLITGIQTMNPMILRAIGLEVQFGAAEDKLAKSLSKTAEELSTTEKMQARTNAVIEAGVNIAGTYEAAMSTAGKMMNSLKRYTDNLAVRLGKVFGPSLALLVDQYTESLKRAEDATKANEKALKGWGVTLRSVLVKSQEDILEDNEAFNTFFVNIAKGWEYITYALDVASAEWSTIWTATINDLTNVYAGFLDKVASGYELIPGMAEAAFKKHVDAASMMTEGSDAALIAGNQELEKIQADHIKKMAEFDDILVQGKQEHATKLAALNARIAKLDIPATSFDGSGKKADDNGAAEAAMKLAEADQAILDKLLPLVREQREYNKALEVLDRMDPTHTTEAYITALANLEASLSTAEQAQKDLTRTTEDYHAAVLASLPEEEAAVMRLTDAYDEQRLAVTAALEQNIITANEAAQVFAGLAKQQEIDTKAVTEALIEQTEAIDTEAAATTDAAKIHAASITNMMRSYRQLNAGMTEHQVEIDNLSAAIEEAIVTGRELGMTESELTEIRQAGIEMTRLAIDEQNQAAFDLAKSFLQARLGMNDYQIQQDNLKTSIYAAANAAYNAGATWGTLNRIIEGGNILLKEAAAAHAQLISDTLAPYRQINAGMSDLEITLDNLEQSTQAAIRAGKELGMTEAELAEIRMAGDISAQNARDDAATDAAEESARVTREATQAADDHAQALADQAEATRQATIAARESAYAMYLSSREIMTNIRSLDMTDYDRTKQDMFFEYAGMTNAPGISNNEQMEIMRALAKELKKLAAEHAESISDMLTPYRQINSGMSDFQIELAGIVEATDDAVRAGKELGLSETELNEIRAAGIILTKNAKEEEAAAAAAKAEEARNALLDKLQSAYDREAAIFKSTIEQFNDFSDSLKSFRDSLKTGDLSTLSPEQKYQSAQASFTDISRRAQLGDVEAISALESSASALLEASRGYNASGDAYVADFNAVTAALDATIGLSDRQSDIAQRQLDALTSQVEGLLKINESVETVADILRAIATGNLVAVPAYANGGYHAGGLRLVGERAPELEATGPSRIWNQEQLGQILSGGGNDTETKALLQQILVELRADKTQRGAVGQATINRLEQVADKLDSQRRVLDRKAA